MYPGRKNHVEKELWRWGKNKENNKKFQLAGVWATRAMDKTGKIS